MGSVLYLKRGQELKKKMQPARATAESLLRPGYNCTAVEHAERVAFLIDAEAYFRAFHQAALRARRSITILGWDFNSQTRLHFDPQGEGAPPALLGDFLNYLVARRRSLHVYVLNWDYPMVFGADREFPPLYGFGWKPAHRVHLRYDDTHPVGGSQHQKIVLIDDAVAFVGGIDLTVRRWDTPRHKAHDPRRIAYGVAYPPFHDMMVLVDAQAARTLAAITRERWALATGQRLKPVRAEHDPWPPALEPALRAVEVGIARTLPARGGEPAVREVEQLYLDMIASAKRRLYIENQYFTAPRLAAALERRLAEPQGPEIILVLRLLSHGWLEEHTMHVLRTRLIRRLRQADRYGRFHVYYPHVPELPPSCCLDVHSKVMVVDEAALRIGSANLCNRSMGVDTECDVLIESRGRPEVAAAIGGFRDRLLAEHLGVEAHALQAEIDKSPTLNGAIAGLSHEGRSLRELDDIRQWPDVIHEIASVADPEEPIALDFLASDRTLGPGAPIDRPAWGSLALFVVAIAALMALWRYTPLAHVVTPESTIAWAKEFADQPWAPWAVMAAYTPACFVMFPRPLITLAGVVAFGPWLGFFYALFGIVGSSVVTYYVGKRMRHDTVRRLAGPRLDRMVQVLKKRGLLAMTLLRLVPIAPFAVEGIVAGAVRLRLWQLMAGTAIGMLPGTLVTTLFGDQVESALSGGEIDWWLLGGCAALLVGGTLLVKRWFSKVAGRIDVPAGGQPS